MSSTDWIQLRGLAADETPPEKRFWLRRLYILVATVCACACVGTAAAFLELEAAAPARTAPGAEHPVTMEKFAEALEAGLEAEVRADYALRSED